jgi:cell division protein FtsQ
MTAARLVGRARRRRWTVPRLPSRLPPRLLIVVATLIVLTGGCLWLRDSPLVAVDHVVVIGEQGPNAARIRAALTTAARKMTTLHVRMDQLRTAVARYPVVKDLQVSTEFPHGLRITVIELRPVATVNFGGRATAVAGDGMLLRYSGAGASLPVIPLRRAPAGSRLGEPDAVHAVALLAAAPYALVAKISQVSTVSPHGLVAQLRNGPSIYFGPPSSLAAKWKAAIAVLAAPGSVGAPYVDVTDPARPVAGAAGSTSGSTTSAATATPATSTPAASTPAPAAPAPATPAAPAPATPANGTPAPATTANATPANGTPASGTPASGTPANGTPANAKPAASTPANATTAASTPANATTAASTPGSGG